jgi:Holliday junction DNA helicase RuvA
VIGRLTGRILDEQPDGSVIVDVAGVGYEVFVPLGTLGRLENRESATLCVHTHVREDVFVLYGFATADDRVAFRALLTVTGVGPKLAIAILSALQADTLVQAIETGDKLAFKGISGVGRKTVEHLLVDLKGKIVLSGGPRRATPQTPRAIALPGQGELVTALLVNMGYKRPEAERAVTLLGEEALAERPMESLIREALRTLS